MLSRFADALREYLGEALDPRPASIGGGYPVLAVELPAVSMSFSEVSGRLNGLGAVPGPVMTGALQIETSLDLAHPAAAFPEGEVELLSPDRLVLQLPHGAIVRADGTPAPPFGPDDLRVALGGTAFTVVNHPPGAGEVEPEPETGELRFGAPLPATGTLELAYLVGTWEVRAARYQGELTLELFAESVAGVEELSRRLEAALEEQQQPPIRGLKSLAPRSWGPVVVVAGVGQGRRGSRSRALRYAFDYELVEPVVRTAGGPIARVEVRSTYGPEQFVVTREGSPT